MIYRRNLDPKTRMGGHLNTGANRAMNRRKFGAGLCAFSLGASPLFSMAMQAQPTNSTSPLATHAIYDLRLGRLTSATKKHLQLAHQIHTYRGDITPIWYNTLDKLWAEKNIRMFGITRHSEFFILKTLAGERDYIVAHLEQYQDHAVWLMQPTGTD